MGRACSRPGQRSKYSFSLFGDYGIEWMNFQQLLTDEGELILVGVPKGVFPNWS
jgi:hypothetical protein